MHSPRLSLSRIPWCGGRSGRGWLFLYHHQNAMARNVKDRQKVASYTPSDQGYNPEEKERREEEEERRRPELTGMEKRIL